MPPRRFGCKDCNSKYSTKLKLDEHRKQHQVANSNVSGDLRCQTCQEQFKSSVLLKKHKTTCKNKKKSSSEKAILDEGTQRGKRETISDAVTRVQKSKEKELKKQVFSEIQCMLDKPAVKSTNNVIDLSTDSKTRECNMLFSVNGVNCKSLKNAVDSTICLTSKNSENNKNKLEDLKIKKPLICDRKTVTSDLSEVRSTPNKKNITPATEKNKLLDEKHPTKRKSKHFVDKKDITKSKSSKTVKSVTKFKKANSNKICSKKKDVKDDNDGMLKKENRSKNEEDPDIEDGDCKPNSKDSSESNAADKSSSILARLFTCAHCNKSFSRKYHLDRHLNMSPCSGLPPLSFPCQVCNRVYSRKDNLREHLRVHTGEVHRKLKHKCHYCEKAFHAQSLLTIHIRKHTGEKPFDCEFCPKKFPSTGALAKHRRTHTGEKPFVCPECGHRFSLKGTLNRHLRVHSGVRPHKCLYCGKQFIQVGGLKAHLFYHTGENGFKCDDCGKIFNRKARLQMHKLYVHVKLRPFTCENCSKSFTRKEDLHRHAILHTGEKPFKCPTCNKSFAIKPSLKLHLLTHIKEEPRSCHECGRAFIRKDCLLRHMRKRHRDLLDKILLDEKDEKSGEANAVTSRILSEEDLCENIQELLSLLVEESTLIGFGWPNKPVDEVLEAVIRRCGHMPVSPGQYSYMDRMRENAKLLFTVVIDDNAVKTLLNNQTVDEVILHVLRLAKT